MRANENSRFFVVINLYGDTKEEAEACLESWSTSNDGLEELANSRIQERAAVPVVVE